MTTVCTLDDMKIFTLILSARGDFIADSINDQNNKNYCEKKFPQRIIATLINKTNTDGNEMYPENEN